MKYKYGLIWKSKLPKLQGKELEILTLHLEQKVSVLKLSEMFECDRKPIQNIIKKNGYSTRPSTSPELDGKESEILKMYIQDQLTIQTIRKKVGCSFNTIRRFLKRNNVSLRSAEESRKTENGRVKGTTRRLTDSKDLYNAIEMYNNGEVLEKIGILYNITPRGLQQKFIKAGVKMRTLTESANLPTTYERKKDTNLKNWGVENPTQSSVIYDRIKATNVKKYGVEYVMQDTDIFQMATKNAHRFKFATIHGRLFTHLQGYEPQGVIYLIEQMGIGVDDIHTGRTIPKIQYSFDGKSKIYFPDLYIPSKNLLVEIKCDYTYNKELEKNKAKRKAALESKYDYLTIIFNNNGKDISKIF
jgi:hypothetical protein